ncbi:hypothetical protein GS464_18395 [Rhodococcus hoagii]|nr:hypothetical protein [Prescottella equi]
MQSIPSFSYGFEPTADEVSMSKYCVNAVADITGQVVMSATAFTQYFDIDTSVSRRFKPYEKDGMLCIDLRGPSVKVVGNRTKRTAQDDSEAQGAE